MGAGRPEIAMLVFVTGVYGICESSVMEKGVAAIAVLLMGWLLFSEEAAGKKPRTA